MDRTNAADALKPKLEASMGGGIEVAVVLGSGIKALEDLHNQQTIRYDELPGMPATTVAGHSGVLSWGRLGGPEGPRVAVARGRFHLYEGHGLDEALALVELFAALGVPAVIQTNAAGGLRADWVPGDLMLIDDMLNFQPVQAGLGHSYSPVEPLDKAWREAAFKAITQAGVPLRRGTYLGLLGPSYETMAENRMLMLMGAEAVGMSTVPEVARAASLGMKVLGISCITNVSVTPKGAAETSHQEVVDVAKAASELMDQALRAAIPTAPALAKA